MNRWFSALLAIALSLTAAESWAAGAFDTVAVADTLYPIGPGTGANEIYNPIGGTTLWESVSEPTADDDATYANRSNLGGDDILTFQMTEFRPTGLVDAFGTNFLVDSIRAFFRWRKTGGANNPTGVFVVRGEGTDYQSDTTTVSSTSYVSGNGHRVQNPLTTAPWAVEDINTWEFGFTNIVNPSLGQTFRVTQFFLVIYYQRQIVLENIPLANTWINSAAPSNNYGGDSVNWVGYDGATGGVRRIIFVPTDTAQLRFWGHDGLIVDSAVLQLLTNSMPGGTHDIIAYSGGMHKVNAGIATGSIQSQTATWNSASHGIVNWDKAGADSTVEDGGSDRFAERLDSVRVSVISTVYKFRVGSWYRHAATQYAFGDTMAIPLIVQQSSEVVGDSTVKFDDSIGVTQFQVFGHYRFIGGSSTPPASSDSLIFSGNSTDAATVAYFGVQDSSAGTTYEQATIGGSDSGFTALAGVLNYWGLTKTFTGAATSNDWTAGTLFGHVLQFRNVYRILSYYGVGQGGSDFGIIDSVVLNVRVQDKSGVDADGVRLKIRGPVLQRPSLINGTQDATGNAWANATPNMRFLRSGVSWKTRLARGLSSGKFGDSTYQWDTLNTAGDTARWDIGYESGADSVIQFTTSQIPAAGSWLAVNVTQQFVAGMKAIPRWDLGGGAVDSIGFATLWTWRDNTGSAVPDSFITAVDNYRIRFNGLGSNATCCGSLAPYLAVYLNQSVTTMVNGMPTRVVSHLRPYRQVGGKTAIKQRGANVGIRGGL